jgi:transketolase
LRDVFIHQLYELAAQDPRITLITADLGFGVLDQFARRYPRQFLNVGVAEQNMTAIATGMALEGHIVFTYSIANFPTLRCLEQLRNDAAYHDANVKVVAIGGGFSYGPLGMSHHATEDLAILRAIPNVTVVSPGDDWEVAEATKALAYCPGTCYLRLDKSSAGPGDSQGEKFRLGHSRRVRDGDDLTIFATGGILEVALEAARRLAEAGLESRVISMHTIKPIDAQAIVDAAMGTGGIVTLEEHVVNGGLGSAVAEICLEAGAVPRAFRMIGLRGGFASKVGGQEYLRGQYGLDAQAVYDAAIATVRAPVRPHLSVMTKR